MKALAKQLAQAAKVLRSFRRVTTAATEKHWVTLCVEKGEAIYVIKEKP